MILNVSVNHRIFNFLALLSLVFFLQGCQLHPQAARNRKPAEVPIGKMVVVGFQPAIPPGGESGPTRSPITGAVFFAEPTTRIVADRLTGKLFERLMQTKEYRLVPPGQARGVFSSIINSGSLLQDIEIAQQIGQTLSAESILLGYTYRWKERAGTDYAVNHPASVAFDLYLIKALDGSVLWKGKFDKTQQSLSENLFDMGTFLKGKGKWMKAEELADLGLESILNSFPRGSGMSEE